MGQMRGGKHGPGVQHVDVLVIGGGPAGSTVATLLAEKGHWVSLAEKDRHPRFHIGESLLPRNIPILRRLGVLDQVERIGVVKRGADFSDADDSRHVVFDFANALAPDEATAFQVKRAEFDAILLSNAAARGVDVQEGLTVTDLAFAANAVIATVRGDDGEEVRLRARFVIDASGREAFLAGCLQSRKRNRRHNSVALYGHFEGVQSRPGEEAGNISITWFEHGWFWLIPLRDGLMSVGAVCWPRFMKTRDGSLEELFWRAVRMTPTVQARLANVRVAREIVATGNFSYRSTRMTGERFLLVGDAYAFIDPVFSSGVYLAMQGAEYAAEAVDGCLGEPRRAATHLKRYERRVSRGLRQFSWFIYRFTSPAMRYAFLNPSDRFRLRSAVISVLTGDVYGRTRLWPRLAMFRLLFCALTLALWRKGEGYRRRLEGAADTPADTPDARPSRDPA